MRKIRGREVIALMCLTALLSCGSNEASTSEEMSVAEALQGTWEWVRSDGGATGNERLGQSQAFRIAFDGSGVYTESGDSVDPIRGTYEVSQRSVSSAGGHDVPVVQLSGTGFFTRFSPDSLLAIRFAGDTLQLYTTQSHTWYHSFTRVR